MAAASAQAQDAWPSRTVKMIVPSSAGGGTDTYARMLATHLTETFKQQFIVENRPGASGSIGADAVAKAAPDGYTLLVSANPALVINPALFGKLPYDADRDFTPVARGVISPLVYCVHASVPARTLAELIALGKRDPGKLTYGSAGAGSTTNLGVRMLEEATGAKYLHVPYKGLGQAHQDLLSGQISFMLTDFVLAMPHIRSGKIVALAATDRTSLLPDTPTLGDLGFPEMSNVHASFMVTVPAGTSGAIVQRLNGEINRIMKIPGVAQRLESHAFIPAFETPEQFAQSLQKERQIWAAFIRRAGITAER
jgi:tripartite-type tricarboxylate transporter receptor subunit TctC